MPLGHLHIEMIPPTETNILGLRGGVPGYVIDVPPALAAASLACRGGQLVVEGRALGLPRRVEIPRRF
jgi:hypothetical protein